MRLVNRGLGVTALLLVLPFAAHAATKDGTPVDALAAVAHDVRDLVLGCDETERSAPAAGVALRAAAGGPGRGSAPLLTYEMTPEVKRFVKYYSEGRGRGTVATSLERSAGWRERAEQIFVEEGVPAELVGLATVESAWKNTAVSPVGAAGVWQFMPATAQDFGMEVSEDTDERLDVEKSTRAAAKYLRRLARRYDGNWELAIGAYNCGEGNMDRAIERAGGVRDFWTLAANDVLPHETAEYVPKVLAASIVVARAGRGSAAASSG